MNELVTSANFDDLVLTNPGGNLRIVFDGGTKILLFSVSGATLTGFTYTDGGVLEATCTNLNYPKATALAFLLPPVGPPDALGLFTDALKNADTETGSNNADFLLSFGGNDSVDGRRGEDTIDGGLGADTLRGGANRDTITGGDGNDFVIGGKGNDNIIGNQLNDTIRGDGGKDTLNGALGNDSLDGGLREDSLRGEGGSDTLRGGGGNDTMFDNLGGNTRYVFTANWGDDIIQSGWTNGSDKLDFRGSGFVFDDLIINSTGGNDAVVNDDAGNSITIAGQKNQIEETDFLF